MIWKPAECRATKREKSLKPSRSPTGERKGPTLTLPPLSERDTTPFTRQTIMPKSAMPSGAFVLGRALPLGMLQRSKSASRRRPWAVTRRSGGSPAR
jgi:hypothetical protein